MKKILVYFSAGCLGGLANSLAVWAFGANGITHQFGVAIAPTLTPAWLYPRIVWGGIWGFVFLLPFLNSKLILKGAIISIFPTLVQLFVVFPLKAHKGYLGLDLGMYTPVFVVIFNLVWGIVAAFAIKFSK
ncbi:MAG: hypothetical protein LJE66_07315 [Desulfobacterales bacterium]|jgi:hypothetical protein|nr:hypothetical protein [Desulfobacterales bacterium]